jgi:MFS family permease
MRRAVTPGFRGWRIAALATLIAALTGPGQTIGVAVYIDHFVSDLHISRSTVAACYLFGTLAGAATLARWGRFIDRLGARLATTIISLAFSLALAAMAGVGGVVSLAVGFLFIRMLGQGALSLASTVAVSMWFERRRGLVLGIVITVSGALMALVPVILNLGIDEWGWRATWLAAAVVIATIVTPASWFGLIDRPSDVGQVVDGQAPDAREESPCARPAPAGVDRATALRTQAFWVLAVVSACVSWLVTALNFHQIALLGEAGLSRGEAAAMFLPQVIGAAVAGVVVGALVDRFGTRLVPSVAMGFMALTLILAGVTVGRGAVVVYAMVLGATTGLSRTAMTTLVPAWFGTAHLGAITGSLAVIGVVGSAVGPVALSLTAAGLGSWQAAALVWLVVPIAIGVVALWTRLPESASTARLPPVVGAPSAGSA